MVGQGCEGVCGVCTCVRWNIWRASMLEIAVVILAYIPHSHLVLQSVMLKKYIKTMHNKLYKYNVAKRLQYRVMH